MNESDIKITRRELLEHLGAIGGSFILFETLTRLIDQAMLTQQEMDEFNRLRDLTIYDMVGDGDIPGDVNTR